MAFKRYDGFGGSIPQKKMDKGLTRCPFCGQDPHWLLEIKPGFATASMTCMCEKCSAKLYTENSGFSYDDNLRVIDTGNENKNNLSLNGVYHITALNTLGNKTNTIPQNTNINNETQSKTSSNSPQLNTIQSETMPNPNRKNGAILGSIVASIIFVILLIVIISPSGGYSGTLTYENYMKINNGMSYSAVCDIFDSSGELSSTAGSGGYTLSYYTWQNSSGTRIVVVGFENGQVCAKSQVGLT